MTTHPVRDTAFPEADLCALFTASEGDTIMAYMDLAAPVGGALPFSFAPTLAARETSTDFNQREWTIVRLARDDSLASLREEGRLMSFLRMVFSFERTTPLANPKLEALRRVAVMSWHHGYNVAHGEVCDFLAAGYSTDQYDALLAHIGRERAASARKNRFWGTRS